MQRSVLKAFPDVDICVGIVWIKMNPKDDLAAARKSLQDFKDKRIKHFYDSRQSSGKLIAEGLPLNAEVAWDIYLFYPKGVTWENRPPKPSKWMHQMSDTDADSEYHLTGDNLVNGLYGAMEILIS